LIIIQFMARRASSDRDPWGDAGIWALRAGDPQRVTPAAGTGHAVARLRVPRMLAGILRLAEADGRVARRAKESDRVVAVWPLPSSRRVTVNRGEAKLHKVRHD
jgi:hypothetical protein